MYIFLGEASGSWHTQKGGEGKVNAVETDAWAGCLALGLQEKHKKGGSRTTGLKVGGPPLGKKTVSRKKSELISRSINIFQKRGLRKREKRDSRTLLYKVRDGHMKGRLMATTVCRRIF